MNIHRLRVVLAKGWYKVVCFVSCSLLSLVCGKASAQKAGDMISGVVYDEEGPMIMVSVTERDREGNVKAHAYTDLEGKFSFTLVNPADRINVTYVGYDAVDLPIDTLYYEIFLKNAIIQESVQERIGPDVVFAEAYGPMFPDLVFTSFDTVYHTPLLYLNGQEVIKSEEELKGFDLTKESYSKKELARLFGVKPRKIKAQYVKRPGVKYINAKSTGNFSARIQDNSGSNCSDSIRGYIKVETRR
jgi:hypothetical protein